MAQRLTHEPSRPPLAERCPVARILQFPRPMPRPPMPAPRPPRALATQDCVLLGVAILAAAAAAIVALLG